MSGITVSIELRATPALVWRIIEPIERHVEWMADAVAIKFTLGDRTALMSAHAVDRDKLLFSTKNCDNSACNQELATLANRPVNYFARFMPSH